MSGLTYRNTVIAERWEVRIPAERADAQNWAKWERCRFDSMANNLERGNVLFDVGTEWGEISAAYAKVVGPENMVLFEPHPETWTIIKRTWEENNYALPRACWVGLVGAETVTPEHVDYDWIEQNGWPACAYGETWRNRSYRYIHEPSHANSTRATTLDTFVHNTGIAPDAVTIDVEGAELEVLRGMKQLLSDADMRPLVWCSVHEDVLERDYGHEREALFNYMQEFDYRSRFLGYDHEEHWLFWPREGEVPK